MQETEQQPNDNTLWQWQQSVKHRDALLCQDAKRVKAPN